MGGRHERDWERKTYTVSPEVAKAVALAAAEQELDPGTIVDAILWRALVKPDEDALKGGSFSRDEIERLFAEEVFDSVPPEALVEDIQGWLEGSHGEKGSLREARRVVKRWRTKRRIEPRWREAVLSLLSDSEIVPRVLKHNVVNLDWFQEDGEDEDE
ncbi:MAG: hypothetical protein H6Q00_2020 [Holophagaceae bacterium]|nr:hypothetical protein [Holophagaceae bacterium]